MIWVYLVCYGFVTAISVYVLLSAIADATAGATVIKDEDEDKDGNLAEGAEEGDADHNPF